MPFNGASPKQNVSGPDTTVRPQKSPEFNSPGSTATVLEIHTRLQDTFESDLTNSDQRGSIYVLLDPNRPELRKIGISTNVGKRQKSIQYACGLKLHLIHERTVDNYKRVEALVQDDLWNVCRPYKCQKCGTKHGEWFNVDNHLARETVDKWVKFMREEQPYDTTSKTLQPFWRHLIAVREPLFKEKSLDIDTLRMHWAHMLSPSVPIRLHYRVCMVWRFVWRFYWQVNATSAWVGVFVAFQNRLTFLFMLSSIVGVFISMYGGGDDWSPRASKSPRKSPSKEKSVPPVPY
ncbi:hypothetical protein P153DRAFT_381702 [Dothidotthia symphoricarpi CBS 119687]|uniref:Bacteriophage T5 Orf172 DNA-binding domain-containing protein n=1 Tax=Dothidotthia symphoricarpi CBS 119687 TaxID=1392245 RepID=A0A6A6AQM5_9PLEO|nr:uncharacterized protein P153DRAFT_381702 [Dothidotthia symphoricarpi CBS 119687]KAF2133264.1 hypothetical protein P153DRAFT_381702 [Dothidotthia symphoricarpi CBS 119687]